MRKTAGITLTAIALMFGGAGVANAAAPSAPIPSSTTTTLADDTGTTPNHRESDKTGLWGLAGLLGLGGLAGLMRRKDTDVAGRRTAAPNTPRV
jgi:MYXO-CTERM domain-containing protein